MRYLAGVARFVCACYLALWIFSEPAVAFDHNYGLYDAFLKQHVSRGLVAYADIRAKRPELEAVLQTFRGTGAKELEGWSREQQLAFWLNAYNLWMIAIVADRYPLTGRHSADYPENSVQQIPGIWDSLELSAGDRKVSLNEIEHDILRKVFHEPRIHFALVCASTGCPELRDEPFRPGELESQLQKATMAFVQDPAKVRLESASKQLLLSSIFQWFPEDFSASGEEGGKEKYGKYAGAIAFIGMNLSKQDAEALRNSRWNLKWLPYDWTLNDQR